MPEVLRLEKKRPGERSATWTDSRCRKGGAAEREDQKENYLVSTITGCGLETRLMRGN